MFNTIPTQVYLNLPFRGIYAKYLNSCRCNMNDLVFFKWDYILIGLFSFLTVSPDGEMVGAA